MLVMNVMKAVKDLKVLNAMRIVEVGTLPFGMRFTVNILLVTQITVPD